MIPQVPDRVFLKLGQRIGFGSLDKPVYQALIIDTSISKQRYLPVLHTTEMCYIKWVFTLNTLIHTKCGNTS